MTEVDDNGYETERQKLQEKRPACSINLKSMEDWVKEDTEFCRPCILPVTIDWYRQELEEQGHTELVQDLDNARMSEDPDATCKVMDEIKEKVSPNLKYRLMEFDCSTQEHAAQIESEGEILVPDEVSPESSLPDPDIEDTSSETLQETLPPEPQEIAQ